jgi:Family of unknown function (DUF6328)
MNISQKVKIALDEMRMLVLGVQILIGFQFRSVFEDVFEQLPSWSRYLDGVALFLMILALALLVLPGLFQQLVEHGNDSGRLHRLIGQLANLALAPFALGLAIDVGIAAERILGASAGIAVGVGMGLVAIIFWYGIEAWQRRSMGHAERAMIEQQKEASEDSGLHEKIDQMLTEARVILPGAQALLGFQLAIVLTQGFEKLPPAIKLTHGMALIFVAVTIVLLMAPAAYHRIVYAGADSESFRRIGSRFVTASTIPLALGLATEVFVVATQIVPSRSGALIAGIAVLVMLVGLWHGLPLVARARKQAPPSDKRQAPRLRSSARPRPASAQRSTG